MESGKNIELRSVVLEYALNVEDGINSLLALKLNIFDKKKTKNFGNRAGISFQSKIDLLYDIGIFEKKTHQNLELQMVFRNKFLHDSEFTSFEYADENLDVGLMKRLKSFGITDEDSFEEKDYKYAYGELHLRNIQVILKSIQKLRKDVTKKKNHLIQLNENSITWIDLYFSLNKKVLKTCIESDLENKDVRELAEKVSDVCSNDMESLRKNKRLSKHERFLKNYSKEDLNLFL